MIGPPVVLDRSIARSVASPTPVYNSVAMLAVVPRAIVPLAAVVGAPRLLLALPPETLFSELTLKTPLVLVVFPEYVLAPDKTSVPVGVVACSEKPPVLLIAPDSMTTLL